MARGDTLSLPLRILPPALLATRGGALGGRGSTHLIERHAVDLGFRFAKRREQVVRPRLPCRAQRRRIDQPADIRQTPVHVVFTVLGRMATAVVV